MFRPDRPTSEQLLPAQVVLEKCPWLWGYDRIWSKGIGSQTGSIHLLTHGVLQQELDWQDGIALIVHGDNGGVLWMDKVGYKQNQSIGQAIRDYLLRFGSGPLQLLGLVIRRNGEIDRSSEFYIFQAPYHDQNRDLLPIVMSEPPNCINCGHLTVPSGQTSESYNFRCVNCGNQQSRGKHRPA